jgi:hypothetical protein
MENLNRSIEKNKYIFADHGINQIEYLKVNEILNEELTNTIKPYIYPHFCFGHDIHVSRIIVFDMLNKNIINNEDVLIVTKDRQFLYSHVFNNILTFEEFIQKIHNSEIIVNKDNFIFLPPVIAELLSLRGENKELLYFNYDVYNKTYWNEKLIENIKNINENHLLDDKLNNIIKNEKFLIFIIRTFNHCTIDLNYLNYLSQLRTKSINKYKLILFCVKDFEINEELYDHKINNIAEYATLLTHNNCNFLIGEISGLLELSYYNHGDNLKILEFHNNHYKKEKNFLVSTYFKESISSRWNAKSISPINHKILLDFDEVLEEF